MYVFVYIRAHMVNGMRSRGPFVRAKVPYLAGGIVMVDLSGTAFAHTQGRDLLPMSLLDLNPLLLVY